MSTIDDQNKKQIRDSMEVNCSISAKDTKADLTAASITGAYLKDSNYTEAIKNEHWEMKKITDFQGDGFRLDGSYELYEESSVASEENGKTGIRSQTGGEIKFIINSNKEIAALTIASIDSSGTITTEKGIEYELQRITILPVNDTSITFTVSSDDPDKRIQIASIVAGISIEFTNENLISCVLGLRSDTSIIDSSWKISDIEVKGYWPDDISEAISNINDDVPIKYRAGYENDYSRERTFYLSEAASMENNVITLKGQDASAKLDDKKLTAVCDRTYRKNAKRGPYGIFLSAITDSKITIRKRETYPEVIGTSKKVDTLIYTEQTARDRVAHFMNIGHATTAKFWPTFVDAGYPHVYWTRPDPAESSVNRGYGVWTIKERECGDVVREVDRNIAKISSSSSDYGIRNECIRSEKKKVFDTKDVTKGHTYSVSFEGFIDDASLSVTNAEIISKSASNVYYKAKKTTIQKKVKEKYRKKVNGKWRTYSKTVTKKYNQCIVKAYTVSVDKGVKSITEKDKRPGITFETSPEVLGMQYYYVEGEAKILYPNYNTLFTRSNIKGSFLWKGDPRMQPRDLFYFERLDGTKELCTIESIIMTHEGGGTKAEITYRKGIC